MIRKTQTNPLIVISIYSGESAVLKDHAMKKQVDIRTLKEISRYFMDSIHGIEVSFITVYRY